MAQYALGLLYETGRGVKADPVEARMWLELAARGGVKEAREEMNSRQASLSPAQLRAARQRVSAWKSTQAGTVQEDAFVAKNDAFVRVLNSGVSNPRVRLVTDPGPAREQKPRAAGTGFFVNSEGSVVTSSEIVKGCREIVVRTFQGEKRAEPSGEDSRLGLTVVAIEGGRGDPLAIAPGSGEEAPAVEVGYGSTWHGSSSANSVLGRISQDGQRREFRAETPSDPPLAGGPVLDTTGRVVAMSVMGEAGPTLIAGDDLLRFLRANHVPLTGRATEIGDLSEIAAAAKRSIVRVECKAKEPPQ
ncbi:MAG: hypothetical protein JWO80_130 [Bryobacterales bacterium]|nr:hypothetical protein [Bryobacterales bacterium]